MLRTSFIRSSIERIAVVVLWTGLLTPAGTLFADTVHLRNGSVIHGQITEDPAGGLRVEIGATGRIWIDAADIDRWERNEEGSTIARPEPATATDDGPQAVEIETTHRVMFREGGSVRGNLVESEEPDQLALSVGPYGTMSFARDRVADVVEEAGVLVVPPARSTPDRFVDEEPVSATFEEIVAALSTEVIERHYAEGFGFPPATGLEAEIEAAVSELSRQRTTNRVRAENALRSFGEAALPFLGRMVNHPSELTRRAVMRLVRDAGAWSGAPLAIVSLEDPDPYVREIAAEAIDRILAPVQITHDGRELPVRVSADEAWQLWIDAERARLEGELADTLTGFLGSDSPSDESGSATAAPAETPAAE